MSAAKVCRYRVGKRRTGIRHKKNERDASTSHLNTKAINTKEWYVYFGLYSYCSIFFGRFRRFSTGDFSFLVGESHGGVPRLRYAKNFGRFLVWGKNAEN